MPHPPPEIARPAAPSPRIELPKSIPAAAVDKPVATDVPAADVAQIAESVMSQDPIEIASPEGSAAAAPKKAERVSISTKDGRMLVVPLLGAAAGLIMKSSSLPQAKAMARPQYKSKDAMQIRASSDQVQKAMFPLSPLLQPERNTGHRIIVSIPDKRVVVFDRDGKEVRNYGAYIGKADSPTPRGEFRIMENIVPDPNREWYYGGHWLGIAKNYDKPKSGSYAGFHGWLYDRQDDEEERVSPGWKTSTHGCVQLSNKDVEDLAGLVGAGDAVSIVDTPFLPPPHPLVKPEVKEVK